MKLAALVVGALLAGVARAADELPIERGLTIRPASVLDFPDRSGRPLGTLPAHAAVDVYERRRLWLRIRPPAGTARTWSLVSRRYGVGSSPSSKIGW